MIVLALGSNCGDREARLREAISNLCSGPKPILFHTKFSSFYESHALLPKNAPAHWNQNFLNCVVAGKTSLTPEALLVAVKNLEKQLGRKPSERWAPREVDIDILLYNHEVINRENLCVPHPEILNRPFFLNPLLEILPLAIDPKSGLPFPLSRSTNDPLETNIYQPPHYWMSIHNVTPDSFSDGGQLQSPSELRASLERARSQGATLFDIGAESTRPHAKILTPREELERLKPYEACLKEFKRENPNALLSLDSRHPSSARWALDLGFEWINDVSGLSNPEFIKILKEHPTVKFVAMHNLGIPADPKNIISESEDVTNVLMEWGLHTRKKFEEAGFSRDRLILDPGIGFGKSSEQSWTLLRSIERLHAWGVPLLVGHSRKSFLKDLCLGKEPGDRDLETAVLSASLIEKGVRYLRIHNVEINARVSQATAFCR